MKKKTHYHNTGRDQDFGEKSLPFTWKSIALLTWNKNLYFLTNEGFFFQPCKLEKLEQIT